MVDQAVLDAMVAEADKVPGLDDLIVRYLNGEVGVAVITFDGKALAPLREKRARLEASFDATTNADARASFSQAMLHLDEAIENAKRFVDNPTFAYWTPQASEPAHVG